MPGEVSVSFSGVVRPGLRRGRQLGFPTANLEVDGPRAAQLPQGVFAGRLQWSGENWHWAVVNIGHRPTFDAGALSIEAHVLDFAGDLYGKVLEVELFSLLRGEIHFAAVEELVAQIALDVENTRNYMNSKALNNAMEV